MEPVAGKLKNLESNEELVFSMNPTEYSLTRNLNYHVEPCLGQPAPLVSFQNGGTTELAFSLVYDSDVDSHVDLSKVEKFLKNLNKIYAKTKSVSALEFILGNFIFRGFVRSYQYQPRRFDQKGGATSAKVGFSLISNGDYENGKV